MKKNYILIIVLVAILSVSVQAKAETGYIHIQANVPESFTETNVMINFWLEDGTNALYTIDAINEYKISQPMPVGNHVLDFVSIYNDLTGRYEVKANEKIHIKVNEGTIYNIEIIDTKANQDKDAEALNVDEVIEHLGKLSEQKDVSIESVKEDIPVEQEVNEEIEDENIQVQQEERGFIYRNRYTLTIIAVLALALSVIKFKKIIFKD